MKKTFREFLIKLMKEKTLVSVAPFSSSLSLIGRITEVNEDYIVFAVDIRNIVTVVGGPRFDTTAIPISPGLVVSIKTLTKK